ncbi:CsgG/HfaB family protein [Chondrinema litorale]|uniref:CsgG/HfaB family protein n=1 Tax=Chondrinema litorale TaxID=2994555 RepID=UPI0025427877|nr:CsgG/HfaB family protein [Chondrinema litorale]UZR95119.1 hypothetical protein OQ292_04720 [Chondrinema litorale]
MSHHDKLYSIFLLIFALSLTQCTAQQRRFRKNAEEAFEQRRFDDAVINAVNSLYEKPEKNTQAQEVLELAFPRFINDYEDKIAMLKASSASYSSDNTVEQRREIITRYETLIKYTNDVKNLPPAAFSMKRRNIELEYKEFYNELAEAKQNLERGKEDAAESHYQEALRLMANGGIDNNKTAAKEFKKALGYVPGYRDAAQKYEDARKAGTTRVAIIPFENKSGKTNYGALGEYITDQVIASIFDDKSAMEFLEIIDREQLELVINEQKLGASGLLDDNTLVEIGKVLGVQEILTGRITQIISDREQVTSENQQVKDNVKVKVGEKKNSDGKTEAVYRDKEVSAVVTIYNKTAGARMSGSYKILDVQTARLLETEAFSESYEFNHEWGSYRGDERALSYKYKQLVQVREKNPLSDGERINYVATKLASDLAVKLKEYSQ